MTGLLLPLTVKSGNFDLYDHSIDPVSLSKAISSPEFVLTITNFASTAALLSTSPLTFDFQRIVP